MNLVELAALFINVCQEWIVEKDKELTQEDIVDILRLARDRAELMRALKAAVIEGDVLKVMEAARRACGLPEEVRQ